MATTTYTWSPTLQNLLLLNSINTPGDQTAPAITASADGSLYFNAWTHPGASDSVQGALANSQGTTSGEFNVNSTTFDDQNDASLATLNNGRYVAAFADYSGVNASIRLRMFEAGGAAPVAADFLVDMPNQSSDDSEPDVAALADGKFVVTWTRVLAVNDTDIKYALYNADGSPAAITSGDALSNVDLSSGSSVAALAASAAVPGGGFVVVCQSNTGGNNAVYFRRFDVNGQALDAGFGGIPIDSVGDNTDIQVAGLPDGGFVVAYTDTGWGISGAEITARVYNADGTTRSPFILVNAGSTAGSQNNPTLTVLSNGYFAIAWTNDSVQHMAAFDADGNALTSEVIGGGVVDSEIAGLADGKVAQTYRSTSPDAGGDDAIRGNIFELARIITGDGTDETLVGGGDTLWEQLVGLDGNDTLEGKGGRDLLNGGSGFDYASYATAPAGVVASLAGPGANTGDAKGDNYLSVEGLIGSAFDDTLTGNSNDNTLDGGAGADHMAGGDGSDTYMVDNAGDVVTENAFEGADIVFASVSYALPDHVDWLMLAAGAGNIDGTGNAGNNFMVGNDGNNVLTGAGGFDVLDGGAGDDTAVFSQTFESYVVTGIGNTIVLNGPDGTTTAANIEHLQFANGAIHLNDGSGLFDTLYYMTHNLDVFHAGVSALDHYNIFGWHEGRDPSAFFDTSGYLAVNKDVAAAGVNPLEHYHQSGWKEGRDPSAVFDTTLYLINNPDVAIAGIDPLEHYLQLGQVEGRQAYAAVGPSVAGGFDAQYYLFHNPDVAAAGVDPLQHFNQFGWKEGRDPNAWFDTAGYLSHYADVTAAGVNPLQHYHHFGWEEGRDPSAGFDTQDYLAANPDVAAAGVDPLEHYLMFGIYEGRQAVNDGMWS